MHKHPVLSLLALFCLTNLACNPSEPEAPPDPPNILLIAVDDLNNDLGCYSHSMVRSPNIDRLAARGMRFDRAYCQYPVCNPSRSSFMTSMYPEQTGVTSNAGDFRKRNPDVRTMSQHFQDQGYYTARVGKIYHYGVPSEIGTPGHDDPASWDETVNPIGIDKAVEAEVKTLTPGQYGGTLSWLEVESEDEEHTDGIGATEAIKLMEQHHPDQTNRPFFLAVGFYRPHTPYVAPSHYFDWYPQEEIDPIMLEEGDRHDYPIASLHDRPKQLALTLEERKEIIQAYYASISLMDAQVGRLLDALDELNLADNTIVVFLSDHGYHLGAHGLWQKGDLFEGSARVPLIVATPDGLGAGLSSGSPVELVDIYPTLADLAGFDVPEHVRGKSLAPILKTPTHQVREAAFTQAWTRAGSTRPEWRNKRVMGYSVRTERYRYTEWGEGRHGIELYDYETDPDEVTNLAGRTEHLAVQKMLHDMLRERVAHATER